MLKNRYRKLPIFLLALLLFAACDLRPPPTRSSDDTQTLDAPQLPDAPSETAVVIDTPER
jgi:hypothetical protein